MIYSNACYAPGAGEGFDEPATQEVAAERVSAYSRAPLAELGASAYFATDFFEGAAHLVAALLDGPDAALPRHLHLSEPRFDRDGRSSCAARRPRRRRDLALHQVPYFEGEVDYWYAFAGDPDATFAGGHVERSAGEPTAGLNPMRAPLASRPEESAVVTVDGSRHRHGLLVLGEPRLGGPGHGRPAARARRRHPGRRSRSYVLICADRCVSLPVVDSCPCYVGTADQRVANLSHEAWRQISDMPLEEGLIEVEITLSPVAIADGGPPVAAERDRSADADLDRVVPARAVRRRVGVRSSV